MDETSYSYQPVIDFLNREFVPIRVDNDRRPDVNQRYNMGGWPTTALLTPHGDVLVGVTYLPPEALLSLLRQVLGFYHTHKAEIYSKILELKARARATARAALAPLPTQATQDLLAYLGDLYDPDFGGFGREPKFPYPEALEFLLEEYHRSGQEQWAAMVRHTLQAMGRGGIFDQIAGGFFRYSTNRDWSIPHYEKMSEDNAALLRLYLRAGQRLGEDEFLQTGQRILDYVLSTLYDAEQGAFLGSQDADEEYYRLSAAERATREQPHVDRTIYVNWNGAMAASVLEAALRLRRPDLKAVALKTLEFLWEACYQPGQGMYHYYDDGRPQVAGLLNDQGWMLQALLDAHEATGGRSYLERAQELIQVVYDCFQDPAGGFFDTAVGRQETGRLGERDKSMADNSLVAMACIRLFHLTGEERHRQAAQGALQAFADDFLRYGPYAAIYARALERLQGEPLRVVVVGPEGEAPTLALLEEAAVVLSPGRVVQPLDPHKDGPRLAKLGFSPGPGARAYVCSRGTCSPPVEEPGQLAAAVAALS
jgi:hypothetical protein